MGTMTDQDTDDKTEAEEDRHSDAAILAQVKRHKKESDQHLGKWREDERSAMRSSPVTSGARRKKLTSNPSCAFLSSSTA